MRPALLLYAAVAAGSVIGGVLRHLAGLAAQGLLGSGLPWGLPWSLPWSLPWGTLFVNVTGSFVIGFYATLTGPDGRVIVGPRMRQFVMAGICGGYTTFSVFSLETLQLMQGGRPGAAALNIAVSLAAWLAAVWAGQALAARLNRLKGS